MKRRRQIVELDDHLHKFSSELAQIGPRSEGKVHPRPTGRRGFGYGSPTPASGSAVRKAYH